MSDDPPWLDRAHQLARNIWNDEGNSVKSWAAQARAVVTLAVASPQDITPALVQAAQDDFRAAAVAAVATAPPTRAAVRDIGLKATARRDRR